MHLVIAQMLTNRGVDDEIVLDVHCARMYADMLVKSNHT